jgi:hypothetical protein
MQGTDYGRVPLVGCTGGTCGRTAQNALLQCLQCRQVGNLAHRPAPLLHEWLQLLLVGVDLRCRKLASGSVCRSLLRFVSEKWLWLCSSGTMTPSQRVSNLDLSFSHLCNCSSCFSLMNLGCPGHFRYSVLGLPCFQTYIRCPSAIGKTLLDAFAFCKQLQLWKQTALPPSLPPSVGLELIAANSIRIMAYCHRGRRITTITATSLIDALQRVRSS